ncbi:MAG TPA: DUF3047 domain-containing protein [Nitrospira sp.]|nr:DUF3047 domain-containing protein [Nitrospira sp.]
MMAPLLMGKVIRVALILLTLSMADASRLVWAQQAVTEVVGRFSVSPVGAVLPEGWKPLTFKKIPAQTKYEVITESGVTVVKAVSEASASGLTKAVRIDLKEFPIVRWRWKVENLLQKSDVTRKDGDDYPARLYITFEYDPSTIC